MQVDINYHSSIAYATVAVSYTLEQSGLLSQEEDVSVIAERLHGVMTETPYSAQLLSDQHRRLKDKVEAMFQLYLTEFLK